jgi:hypothetical protein
MTKETVELRGLVSADLAKALDAIALAKGINRHAYVVSVLEAEVDAYLQQVRVVSRALKGNPLLTDSKSV